MPPVVIQQSETLAKDLMYGIPGDCNTNTTFSHYIDSDGYLKDVSHFMTTYGETEWNQKII